jgi:hypothetical protein
MAALPERGLFDFEAARFVVAFPPFAGALRFVVIGFSFTRSAYANSTSS